MTLDQLSIFVAVAERQHLTRAAEALNLTPSAVSAAIRTLETNHNVRLFDRIGRGLELTREGRIFLDRARAVIAEAQSARHLLREFGGLGAGALDIYASQTIASYWLPPRLVRFHEANPGVEISLRVGNTREVAEAVLDGRAEIGFVEGDIDAPALVVERLAEDELVIVVRAGHPLARHKKLRPSDLVAGAQWIRREAGSGTRSAFEAGLRTLGCDPDSLSIALILPSNEAILAAVRSGPYAAAVSRSAAQPFLDSRDLVALDAGLPPRAFRAVRHRERHQNPAAKRLEEMCKSDYADSFR